MGTNEKATPVTTKNAEQINELVEELGTIRLAFTEIISRFQSNLEAEIVWCIDALLQKDTDNRPKLLRHKKELKLLLEQLQALKIKPQKGRFKDIRKIHELVNIIYAKLID